MIFNACNTTINCPLISHLTCMEGPMVDQAMFVANLYQAKGSMGYMSTCHMVHRGRISQFSVT